MPIGLGISGGAHEKAWVVRMKPYDTIIIGAGIAGLTAAIYAARKRMRFEIISPDFGGQMLVNGEIHNYPGLAKITGYEFRSMMEQQMESNGVKVRQETVKGIERLSDGFSVKTDKGTYSARTVIIATGSHPGKLGVPGEDRLRNRGVTYCTVCDGPLFSGMEVAIIGGGNSAMEAVGFLKDIASKIHLVVRGPALKGHEYLREKVEGNPKVDIMLNARTTEILGDGLVTGIKYIGEGGEKVLAVRGVIIEAGRTPNTEPFRWLLELDESGHIKIDCQCRTSVPGIFAAGDCASGQEYQYIISAGQGCMALLKAAKHLSSLKS